jgi:hypothetical protein
MPMTAEQLVESNRLIATMEAKAAHWDEQARIWKGFPVEEQCRDYAQHIRVMVELQKLKQLD